MALQNYHYVWREVCIEDLLYIIAYRGNPCFAGVFLIPYLLQFRMELCNPAQKISSSTSPGASLVCLLDPQHRSEGSYKIGFCPSVFLSAHLSARLSVSFLRIGSLVFSETQRLVLGAHIQLCVTEPDFLGKIPFGQK